MPSSISNFELPTPAGRWGLTWLMALFLSLLALAGVEILCRIQGLRPSVNDTPELWCYWRQQARDAKENTIVWIGSSRIHLGLSPQAWLKEFPGHQVIQLGIDGAGAIPILRNLADDPSFAGTVICEMQDFRLLDPESSRAEEYLKHYNDQWIPSFGWQTRLKALLEGHLVLLRSKLNVGEVITSVFTGRKVHPEFIQIFGDRTCQANYCGADLVRQRNFQIKNLLEQAQSPEFKMTSERQVQNTACSIRKLALRIQQRGGRVVFVRFPSADKFREIEDQSWPRNTIWNRFADVIGEDAIHFEDVQSLRGFACPDGSHLDQADSPNFTSALAKELASRRLVRSR